MHSYLGELGHKQEERAFVVCSGMVNKRAWSWKGNIEGLLYVEINKI